MRSAVVEGMLWLLLCALIGLSVLGHEVQRQTLQETAAAGSAAGTDADPALLMGAQEVLALKGVAGDAAVREAFAALEQLARGEDDRLRLAILAGAVFGEQAALRRLDALAFSDGRQARVQAALLTRYHEGPTALEPAQRELIGERYGWFGELALAERQRMAELVLDAQQRSVLLLLTGLAALGLLALGAFCAALFWRRWRSGSLSSSYHPDARERLPLLSCVLCFVLLLNVYGVLVQQFVAEPGLALQWGVVPLFALLLFAVFAGIGWPWRSALAALGWRRGAGVWREIGAGLSAYCAGMPVVIGVFLLSMWLAGDDFFAPHPIQDQVVAAEGWSTWLVLASLTMLWAPLLEETVFRGALFGALRSRFAALPAGIASGLCFAALHPQGVWLIPTLAALGCVFALMREWRDSLIAPVSAHAFHNGMVTWMAWVAFG